MMTRSAIALTLAVTGCHRSDTGNDASSSSQKSANDGRQGDPGKALSVDEQGAELLASLDPGSLRNIHLTETHVYFSGNGGDGYLGVSVERVPKAGGALEVVGPWSGQAAADLFASDETYVYWLHNDHLNRVPKGGTKITEIPLGRDDWHTLASDGDDIYLAAFGCLRVGLLSLDPPGVELLELPDAVDVGGDTVLLADHGQLYCARLGGIHAVDWPSRQAALIHETDGRIASMVQSPDALYFVDVGWAPTAPQRIFRLDKSSGRIAEKASIPLRGTNPLLYMDVKSNQLYIELAASFHAGASVIDLATGEVTTILEDRAFAGGFTGDGEYLYWLENRPEETSELTIGEVYRWKMPQ